MNSLGKLSETGLKVSDLGIFKTLGKVWKSLGFEQILSEISRKPFQNSRKPLQNSRKKLTNSRKKLKKISFHV